MIHSEQDIQAEVDAWLATIQIKETGFFERMSKGVSATINSRLPQKYHDVVTGAIKGMIQATLFGSNLINNPERYAGESLLERDARVVALGDQYRKLAIGEGALTGAGGFVTGLADFPLLLTIQMKFLSEMASLYGFNPKDKAERIFLLRVFELAYSTPEHRRDTWGEIVRWQAQPTTDLEWQTLQQEYRDNMDFVKMLQLVPGIGAAVGAIANHSLMKELETTAQMVYRWRWLQERQRR